MSVTVHVKTQMMPLRLVRILTRLVRILTHCLARILVSLYRCSERCWQSCSKLLHFTKSTIYITISEACLQYNCIKKSTRNILVQEVIFGCDYVILKLRRSKWNWFSAPLIPVRYFITSVPLPHLSPPSICRIKFQQLSPKQKVWLTPI